MIRVQFTTADGTTTQVDGETGDSLMEVAMNHGIDGIYAECGGGCSCGTCRVVVADDWIGLTGTAGEIELALLEDAGLEHPNARLACQIELVPDLDGIAVRIE